MAECYLYRLPNELLIHLLTPMTTSELLPLTTLSHRIYTIVLRILHNRLVIASELDSHSVLLECYHPSAKLTAPRYFCSYHGTDGLSLYDGFAEDDKNLAQRLGEMRNMYSRFRPHLREEDASGRRVLRGPPGDVPGSRTYPGTTRDGYDGDTVKQVLGLDEHELFTQLSTQAHIVKMGPRFFLGFQEIEDGTIRVWREWLRDIAAKNRSVKPKEEEPVEEVGTGKGREAAKEVLQEEDHFQSIDDEKVLWVSPNKNTGIRFNVRERKIRRDIPILVRADEEDMPVSYEVEYDELLIRTSHLLLTLEKSLAQDDNSGKAVVFGSFG